MIGRSRLRSNVLRIDCFLNCPSKFWFVTSQPNDEGIVCPEVTENSDHVSLGICKSGIKQRFRLVNTKS